MKRWSRWQDWTALVAGVYALLSPIWTDTTTKATWTLVVLGVVTGGVALFSLAGPGTAVTESEVAILGVLFFIAPWVMGFSSTAGIAWTSWIVGIVAFVVGLAGLPEGRRVSHSQHHLVGQH